jgi:hypothetical protein
MKWPSARDIARAYAMSIPFWWGFALLMGLQYRPIDRDHVWASIGNLLFEGSLRGFALSFWTPPIFFLVGRCLSYSTRRIRYVLLWSLAAPPFVVLNTSIVWLIAPPYDETTRQLASRSAHVWMEMVRGGFADHMFMFVAIVVAAHAYWYLKRLKTQEREKYEYQQALAASELQALKMQLHPHFLFNTLHGISTLIDTDSRSAKAMIVKLSSLLRRALDRDASDLVPLEDELKFVREYLDIEKMRLGNRLRVDWNIAPDTSFLLVPQMILQPLAENAIRHGVASLREGGWLEISSGVNAGILTINLSNSVGASRSANGTGLGLRNAQARLGYLFSKDASLHFEHSDDRTATVVLTLPALNSQRAPTEKRKIQAVH